MIKATKSASIFGSEHKENIEYSSNSSTVVQWYSTMYQNRNQFRKVLSGIPTYKQSHPYCLTLHKISSLSVSKKNASSSLFINISGFLATEQFQILGIPFVYQYEQSLSRGDNRWQVPLCLFYHSKIDKNYEGIYLFLKVRVLQIKETFVENLTDIGTIIVKSPFSEIQHKAFPVYSQINEADFGFMLQEVKDKMLVNTSPINVQISIESKFQLKKLSKFVYENSIYTHQSFISGARKGYLQRVDDDGLQFKEANSIPLKVVFLQIHVSQKYQQDLITYLKKIWPNQKITDVKSRKIVIGYHNQYVLVSPNHRKLQLLSKDIAGQQRILVYEALKEGEIIKLPCYADDNYSCGMLIVGLIYEVNGKQLQIASYYFLPAEKGQEVSEHMMTGTGYGSTYQMIAIPSSQKPTIIMQYECDAKQMQTFQDTDRSRREMNSKKWEDEQLIKQKQKLKEEIQRQRIEIMREKQQMQKLKNEHYLNFQAEFQKKFEVEKENLYKKQQLIENQYRQQVERQIRQRFTLQEQIKKMNEKLKNIEQSNFKQSFQENTYRNNYDQAPVSSPRFSGGIQTPMAFPPQRQRIDPSYIIEPQNPVPVKKVREILQKQPKVSIQIIKQSEQQFNFASKFTFYFTSMVWAQHVDPPKQIYLMIRFFNLQEFRTDNLTYLQGEGNYYQLVRSSHLIQGNQNQEPSYSFLMDPSDYSEPYNYQKDLINYLVTNSAIIDVFCGETHLYIGQVKIKLKELVRGNKTQTLIAKDLALVKLKDKDRIGTIQVMIKNEQTSCKSQISLKHKKKIADVKKKVVSNAPIFIKEEQATLKTDHSENYRGESIKKRSSNTTRQQLRIQKFKEQKALKSFSQTTNGFNQLDDGEKGVVLTKIMNYKEQKMQDYIKEVYEGLLNEQINLSAHYGKAVTFLFLFQNTSPFPASFKISFISTESSSQQLSVVKNNKQWRFLCNQHSYGQPKRFDMISQNDIFFLHAGESIPLVFKFLSFDTSSSNKDKMINVTICKQDNNWIAGGFSLLVQMHQPIVHHSYILYEPGDQMVDLIVPVIYSQTDNTAKPQKLHLTDPSPTSTAHWLSPYQILIRIKTPKIMDKLKFNLLLYNDQYFCELSQNWLIQVYAYEGVSSYFRSDFNTKFKITLPWSAIPAYLGLLSIQRSASTVKLFSSSSALVFKNNEIELDADRRTEGGMQIWCELLGGQNSRKSFEITCVGGQQNQLIYGWVVTVFPYMPRT